MQALAPGAAKPEFNPVQHALEWLRKRYGAGKAALGDELLACVISREEALYFPPDWWHLVLNVGEVVVVSSFKPHRRWQWATWTVCGVSTGGYSLARRAHLT